MPVLAETMFRCELCGQNSQPRSSAYKITIETRSVSYHRREKVNACRKRQKDGTMRFVRTDDRGGFGQECVREMLACAACAAEFSDDPGYLNVQRNGHRKRTA